MIESKQTRKSRLAVLISGRGSNMSALIEAVRQPDYPAEIALVASNKPEAIGLKSAKDAGIATACVPHKAYGADRMAFEQALHRVLQDHAIDFVVLAGFMRVLTPWFISQWPQRLINIHPSLLPSFTGLHTHERALAAGCKVHGCTVHHVVPEVDAGAIIAQAIVPVLPHDTPDSLAQRVLQQEHRLYPAALRLVLENRTHFADGTALLLP